MSMDGSLICGVYNDGICNLLSKSSASIQCVAINFVVN